MKSEPLTETAKHMLPGYRWLKKYEEKHDNQRNHGIDFVDLGYVWIDERAVIGRGTTIFPNASIRGETIIGENCVIDSNSIIEWSCLGSNIYVGPFAQIRRTSINNNSRVPHRCYLGDAEIGQDVNIGDGVTCGNFDGWDKNKTIIKDGAFIGIHVKFLAQPGGLVIGKEARIFPGQTIQVNIPDHAFVTPKVKDGIVREHIKENRSFKIPGHWKWLKTRETTSPQELKSLFLILEKIFGDPLPWLTDYHPLLSEKPIKILIEEGDDGIRILKNLIISLPI